MRLNNLPNWCIPDSSPAFYDTDSKSVLDQTAKLYGIIKKLVADYNEYAKELDKGMDDLETEVKRLQTELEERITKLIHDYIVALDAKVDHQDRVIEENITYIKNNIGSEVTRIIDEMKESGELEVIIADSLDSINTRLNEIETNISTIQTNLSALIPKVNTNETKITALQTQVNNLEVVSNYNINDESLTIGY